MLCASICGPEQSQKHGVPLRTRKLALLLYISCLCSDYWACHGALLEIACSSHATHCLGGLYAGRIHQIHAG